MYKSLMTEMIGIDAGFLEAIELAAKHGFSGIDLGHRQVAALVKKRDLGVIRDAVSRTGIRAGCWWLVPPYISVSEAEWQQGLAVLPEQAALAESLRYIWAACVVLPFHQELDLSQNSELHVKRISQLAGILADHGMRLGLEYIAPETRRAGHRYHFVSNMDGLLDLCGVVGAPNVGLVLDSFHWYCARESTADICRLSAEHVAAVHLSDAVPGRPIDEQNAFERRLPEVNGVIDLRGFIDSLAHIGYDGPLTCEPMSTALSRLSDDEAAARVSAAMDKVMERC